MTYTTLVSVYAASVSVIPYNKVDINCDTDCDPVHYGVVYEYIYEYVYANEVARYYSIIYKVSLCMTITNGMIIVHSPQYVILDRTVRIQDDGTGNYVVNDII